MSDNIAVLIDGYNFYHAICSHMNEVHYPRCLKWLDYDCVARNILLKGRPYNCLNIRFYTANNTFKCDKNGNPHKSINSYNVYTQALKTRNIEVIEGQFKFRDEHLNSYVECRNCQHTHFIHKININFPTKVSCTRCGTEILPEDLKCLKKVEEKKTDVKIAIDLVNLARDGHFNKIFLFSTDSDFIPPAEYIKQNCPNVELIIVAPSDKISRKKYNLKTGKLETSSRFRYNVTDFKNLGISVLRIRISKFINCLFPDEITSLDNRILRNPWLLEK